MRRVKFRLAALLGMTVGELEMRMSAREFSEWIELLRVDPWGPYRSDLQHALSAWSPIAAAGGKAKVEDFLPSDRSDQIMLIGTHHDAPFFGATEDAVGAALVLAQAAYWSKVPRAGAVVPPHAGGRRGPASAARRPLEKAGDGIRLDACPGGAIGFDRAAGFELGLQVGHFVGSS